ncbi:MAG: 3-alpha,7-alpha,12-alpha-trihydroxy-5-beta-cholest-24-enoyl-CoA hydratase [Sphingomonadales bacterium]|nr:MAG: 3-alpha,7-alpha,12-alpha-trihydroxy-5-beta-cholest-24-enoyl-CoA hydratase [Sphingomonadales bacterium]
MALDPDFLLASAPTETRQQLTPEAVILYALGVGASELPFVYEDGLKALPTIPVVLAYPGFVWQRPEYGVDWRRVLHGETSVELHAPLPVSGEVIGRSKFGPIFDKGADKGAIVYTTRTIHTADGVHVATVRNASFLRGDGGFGGTAEGQPRPHAIPDRPADLEHSIATADNQALIYRLSGDFNPLHADPAVAEAAGFPRPILHGLATFGVAGRAVIAALCGNEPERLKRIDVRFSSPVFPGETIRTEIWHEGEGRAAFRARVVERDVIVLNNGYVEFA